MQLEGYTVDYTAPHPGILQKELKCLIAKKIRKEGLFYLFIKSYQVSRYIERERETILGQVTFLYYFLSYQKHLHLIADPNCQAIYYFNAIKGIDIMN